MATRPLKTKTTNPAPTWESTEKPNEGSDNELPSPWEGPSPEQQIPQRQKVPSKVPETSNDDLPANPTTLPEGLRHPVADTESNDSDDEFWDQDEDLTRIIEGQLKEKFPGVPPAMPEPSLHPAARQDRPLTLEFPSEIPTFPMPNQEIPKPWEEWQTQEGSDDSFTEQSGYVRPFAPIGGATSFPRTHLAPTSSTHQLHRPPPPNKRSPVMPTAPPQFPVDPERAQGSPPGFPQYPRIPVHDNSETDLPNTTYPRMPINDDSDTDIPPVPGTPPPFPSAISTHPSISTQSAISSQGSVQGTTKPSHLSSSTSNPVSTLGHTPNKPFVQPSALQPSTSHSTQAHSGGFGSLSTLPTHSDAPSIHINLPYKPQSSPPHTTPSKPSTPLKPTWNISNQSNQGLSHSGAQSKPPTQTQGSVHGNLNKPTWTSHANPSDHTTYASNSTNSQSAHKPPLMQQTPPSPPKPAFQHNPEHKPATPNQHIRPQNTAFSSPSVQSTSNTSPPLNANVTHKPPSNQQSSLITSHSTPTSTTNNSFKPPPNKPAKPTHVEHSSKPTASSSTPSRPQAVQKSSQISTNHTRYVNMLLALDDIPNWYNLLASFFTWILLAGFLLFPGTFTSLRETADTTNNELQRQLINAVTNIPLFIVAWLCCGLGVGGMLWLWWRWMNNYIWLLSKIFVPGFMNALAGVITTLVNVYGVQDGQFSTTAKVTVIVVSSTAGVTGGLFLFYQFWLLRRVRAEHEKEIGEQAAGRHGEGVLRSLVKSKNSERKSGA